MPRRTCSRWDSLHAIGKDENAESVVADTTYGNGEFLQWNWRIPAASRLYETANPGQVLCEAPVLAMALQRFTYQPRTAILKPLCRQESN